MASLQSNSFSSPTQAGATLGEPRYGVCSLGFYPFRLDNAGPVEPLYGLLYSITEQAAV